jgi:hypothetical protein
MGGSSKSCLEGKMLHILVGDRRDYQGLFSAIDSKAAILWIVPKTALPGDEAFFMLPGVGIAAVGEIMAPPKLSRRLFGNRVVYRAPIKNVKLLNYQVHISIIRSHMPSWKWPTYPRSYTSIDSKLAERFRRLIDSYFETPTALEGIHREVKSYTSSRSRRLRDQAVALSRGVCEVCGKDFSRVLSGLGIRVLQGHHRKQRGVSGHPTVTSLKDLSVLCANCHLLIHTDPKHAMPVKTLRRKLREGDR